MWYKVFFLKAFDLIKGAFLWARDGIKEVSLKAKAILIGVGTAIGFVAFAIFKSRNDKRLSLEMELESTKRQIEIEKANVEIGINEERIAELEAQEEDIRRKIVGLDKEKPSEDVTMEELDEFFDKRGF